MTDQSELLLLFQKPFEPFYTPKVDVDGKGTVEFIVPNTHQPERYDDMVYHAPAKPSEATTTAVINTFASSSPYPSVTTKTIIVEPIDLPDLSFAEKLKQTDGFSLFNETHMEIAGRLTKIFMDADSSKLFRIAADARNKLNACLFQYAFSVALQHRPDTRDVTVQNIVTTFPSHFVASSAMLNARKELMLYEDTKRQDIDVEVNYTATDKESEQRMAYFREDIAVNSHHWHWHSVYPAFYDENLREVVDKDRRGELFYYMHNQMLHRYNIDRINNDLPLVRPLNNFRIPMPEAYFPKLVRGGTGQPFPSRHKNSYMSDIHRPKDYASLEVGDLERWRDLIYHAIDQGFMIDKNGKQVLLTEDGGINILGNAIEASALSPNFQLYGNLHNQGHNVIAYSHDPEDRYLETAGVMSMVETAMRDPIFYRWHAFIDGMFSKHKGNIPQYVPKKDLIYDRITVTSVNVTDKGDKGKNDKEKRDLLQTYWQKSRVALKNGIEFTGNVPIGEVYAAYTHLQHRPFQYTIEVLNDHKVQRFGTCRIFMCPVTDGRNNKLTFEEQRALMIELDRFKVTLKPGTTTIRRYSDESSVTIRYDQLFANEHNRDKIAANNDSQNKYCGCGWPEHMLLPKGTINGARYYIFVMISNFDDDKIDQPDDVRLCDDGASFCGLKDRKYPDKRSMGFPFDRPYTIKSDKTLEDHADLSDFVALGKNMYIHECEIQFCDKIIEIDDENGPTIKPYVPPPYPGSF